MYVVYPAPNVFKQALNFSYARSQLRVFGGAQVVRSFAPRPVLVLISLLQGGGTPGLLERQGYIVLDGEDEGGPCSGAEIVCVFFDIIV